MTQYKKQITTGKNFLFEKIDKELYSISYNLENSKILMTQLITIDFFKVVSQLNSDNFEVYDFKIINNKEAIVFALIKNIFKEITPIQQYYCFKVTLHVTNESAIFTLTPYLDSEYLKQYNLTNKMSHLPVKRITNTYKLLSQHKVLFIQDLIFNDGYQLNFITETILGMLFKIASKKIIKFIRDL